MHTHELTATLCQTHQREPLAVIDGLPGGGAELTPAQLRALAETLVRIAADAEAQPMTARHFMRKRREYSLTTKPSCERG